MASRLSIFEGGKGGDSSSALGRGGGVDVRSCGRATAPAWPSSEAGSTRVVFGQVCPACRG